MAYTTTNTSNNITLVGTSAADAFGNQGTADKTIKVNGFAGNDTLTVNAGVTSGTIGMGAGTDTVTVNTAVAKKLDITLGAGDDAFTVGSAADGITVGGQDGADTFTMTAAALNSRLSGGKGVDDFISTTGDIGTKVTIQGGSGNDIVGLSTARFQTGTNNFINGQAGEDSIYLDGTAGITVHGGSEADTISQTTDVNSCLLSGDKGADTITDGAGDNTIKGGGGADTITSALGADTVTGGLGKDDFKIVAISGAAAAQVDDITDFTVADDQVGFDISDLETFESGGGASDLINVSTAASIAATNAGTVTKVTGNYNLATSGSGAILAFGSDTAYTVGTLSDAMEVGGNRVITAGSAIAANDGFVVFYDDNVDSYAAYVTVGTLTAAGASFASTDLTITNIAKFSGVSDATTIASANVLAFVA